MTKSFHPLALTGLWLIAANLFSVLIPVFFAAADMAGGLIAFALGVPLGLVSFLWLNFYGAKHVWETRPSIVLSIVILIAPAAALVISLWLLPALAEFSWQATHGPRDVPIRPAFPIGRHS